MKQKKRVIEGFELPKPNPNPLSKEQAARFSKVQNQPDSFDELAASINSGNVTAAQLRKLLKR